MTVLEFASMDFGKPHKNLSEDSLRDETRDLPI
jgi:hypothetical protein